jgi:hypothetical protein
MFVIVQSDGDIDYTSVFGPFATAAEAQKVTPDDNDDYAYRVEPVQNPEKIV